jgi:AI-2 transport protein TqsA
MAEKRDEYAWLMTGSLMVLAAAAIAVVLLYTRAVMIPFVLAVFVLSLVSPILDFQVIRLKVPRPVAVVLTFLIVIVIIVVMCLLATRAVQTVVGTVGNYTRSFADLAERIVQRLSEWGMELDQDKIVGDLRQSLPSLVTSNLARVFGLLSSAVFVLVFVGFLLAGRNPRTVHSGVYADMDVQVRRYILIKVTVSTMTGLLVWAALTVIGLEPAGVFGMLAFLLNFIPSIGSIISTLLPIPLAVAQFADRPWIIVYVVAVPGIIQMAIGNVVEPKLMGNELNLHPVTILLALSFWGLLWGVAGMFLAAPMTAVLRIVLMQSETLRPVGRLLAGELPGSQTDSS